MLNIVSLLWKPNGKEHNFSRHYDESWAVKLFDAFGRNLTVPHKFCLFVDEYRDIPRDCTQYLLHRRPITYGSCMEVYRLNEPMIVVGLDTIVLKSVDAWAAYATDPNSTELLLPRDPYRPDRFCNGVQIVPEGFGDLYQAWDGQNDMDFIRRARDLRDIDEVFPDEAISYKVHYRDGINKKQKGLTKRTRVVYFHGKPKMQDIDDAELLEHWR